MSNLLYVQFENRLSDVRNTFSFGLNLFKVNVYTTMSSLYTHYTLSQYRRRLHYISTYFVDIKTLQNMDLKKDVINLIIFSFYFSRQVYIRNF